MGGVAGEFIATFCVRTSGNLIICTGRGKKKQQKIEQKNHRKQVPTPCLKKTRLPYLQAGNRANAFKRS